MKNFLLLSFIVLSSVCQAQYTFKVTPKTFTDEVGVSRTVTGIQARIVSNIEINLGIDVSRTFFIQFQLQDNSFTGQRNATTDEFIAKAVSQGASEENATSQVRDICYKLEYGTSTQKYNAAVILAGMYGYQLLPKAEQD